MWMEAGGGWNGAHEDEVDAEWDEAAPAAGGKFPENFRLLLECSGGGGGGGGAGVVREVGTCSRAWRVANRHACPRAAVMRRRGEEHTSAHTHARTWDLRGARLRWVVDRVDERDVLRAIALSHGASWSRHTAAGRAARHRRAIAGTPRRSSARAGLGACLVRVQAPARCVGDNPVWMLHRTGGGCVGG
jgi:hypothetical protein